MLSVEKRIEVFETMPVKKAVLHQVAPSVLSQMVALLYNLADTYFVGLLNSPMQTAAVTVSTPPFLMLTAVSNLFGVGGASAISRALGRKEPEKGKQIAAISFWLGLAAAIVFSLLFGLLAAPILTLCGAKSDTIGAALSYTRWTIAAGGVGTVLNILLANLVRSEGNASMASVGVSFGGVLNMILDPFFVLPQFLNMGASGAGLATAISNLCAALFLLSYLLWSQSTVLHLAVRDLRHTGEHLKNILRVGFPSCLQYALTVVATAAQGRFIAKYATEAIAALGIVKKIDMLPLYVCLGISTGLLPMLAYNYAAGNQKRRQQIFRFGCTIAVSFALFCVVIFECLAPQLTGIFINDAVTVRYASQFLRRMVLAMPLMSLSYPMIIQFQAMGKARESLICSILRKGVLDIPLLFLLDRISPLYGCMWVQPIVDTIALSVSLILYKKLKESEKI